MTSPRLPLRLLKLFCLTLLLLGAYARPTHAQNETTPIQQKLKRIILPDVEFHETTVTDALEFLRQECRRLDPDPDPAKRGLNLFLKLPTPPQPLPGDPVPQNPAASAHPRITLSLHRIPLGEALDYIARAVDMKIRVEPYAVSLVPLTDNNDPLINATFRVSPNFIPNKTTTGDSPNALDKVAAPAP